MKIAIYLSGDTEQLILTPEDDEEALLLKRLKSAADTRQVRVQVGQMYLGLDRLMHQASSGYTRVRDSTFLILKEPPQG
jgi:hypothetical protein